MEKHFFFCIGAQKAGTTWIYDVLKNHPQVGLPPFKELHFFNEIMYKKSPYVKRIFSNDWNDSRWRFHLKRSIRKILKKRDVQDEWWTLRFHLLPRKPNSLPSFKKLLAERSRKKYTKVVGDVTPDYSIINLGLIEKVHSVFREAKIILILRNPIEREWSHAKMLLLKHKKREYSPSLDAEFHKFFSQTNALSEYPRIIRNWSKYYEADKFGIFFFDELQNNPASLGSKLCDFLEIRDYKSSSVDEISHKGIELEIPSKFKTILQNKYRIQILELSKMLEERNIKHYCEKWLY